MSSTGAASLLGLFATFLFGAPQQPPDSFDVASVKPATTREMNGIYTYPGGRVACRGCWLEFLIEQAFNMQRFQVTGGPGWMDSERWEIEAQPPASSRSSQSRPPYPKAPPNDEQRRMLQSLLAERFQLKYHRETRQGPVYLLTRGSKPLKMQEPKDKDVFPWSGSLAGGALVGDGLAGINESMGDLAWRLSRYLERPVLDQTGITGSFDFRVEYRSDDPKPDVISMILSTVQDLGLKLEPSRGPVDHLVIEHAEKPSGN